jgi:hypothetical protein
VGKIGARHDHGVTGGPLDQLELVAIGIDERHRPWTVSAARSLDLAGVEPGGEQLATRGLEVIDLEATSGG